MDDFPSRAQLEAALISADAAHDDYERTVLRGMANEQWAGFFAAYVIGRLGDFAPVERLVPLLAEVPENGDWPASAAEHVLVKLRS